MKQPVLGFVVVGRTGSLMRTRLLQRGHEVHVYDVSAEALAAMTAQGIVSLSLPNPAIVHQAALNADGCPSIAIASDR